MILNELDINVLVLYDAHSMHVNTIKEHLESFRLFSRLRIYYSPATRDAVCDHDLSLFDVVVIHFAVRLSLVDYISKSYVENLKTYGGYKVLFIQDEYDTTETARKWIEELGIHTVFTCVPLDQVDHVYPKARFPQVEFLPTLTGYVPHRFEAKTSFKPLTQRSKLIGYRGRKLPYWYGSLGQEKFHIGIEMRRLCKRKKLKVDIECDDNQRIYGEDWYTFLENSRATLGTESGSNVFDDDGEIRNSIETALKKNPNLTYEEAYELYIRPYEGKVTMNQVSPKIFEAIGSGTALILFEGEYSGVVQPHKHYIPLKKDFSNVEEVLKKLENVAELEELTQRAYHDIVASGLYSYKKFILDFDQHILKRVRKSDCARLILVALREKYHSQMLLRFDFLKKKALENTKKYLPNLALNFLRKVRAQLGSLRS